MQLNEDDQELLEMQKELEKIFKIHDSYIDPFMNSFVEFVKLDLKEFLKKDDLQKAYEVTTHAQSCLKKIKKYAEGMKEGLEVYESFRKEKYEEQQRKQYAAIKPTTPSDFT